VNDFDEDYTYHGPPLPPVGKWDSALRWTGGQVTARRLGDPYPPPPYDPYAYPAGPDCRTADEKTQGTLAAMQAQIDRLAGEVAALRGEMLLGLARPVAAGAREDGDHADR